MVAASSCKEVEQEMILAGLTDANHGPQMAQKTALNESTVVLKGQMIKAGR